MVKKRRRRKSVTKEARQENPPPQKVVLRAMADLEKTLAQRFQEQKKQLVQVAQANAPLRDKLLPIFGNESAWAASSRRARRTARTLFASHHMSVPKALPLKADASVFLASNGGTRLVPFDYSWSSPRIGGINAIKADDVSGDMEVDVSTDFFGGGLEAYAAVGIVFRLPAFRILPSPAFTLPASLTVSANPSVHFCWATFFGPGAFVGPGFSYPSSFGFIGLLLQRFDWNEPVYSEHATTLISQEIPLWREISAGYNGISCNVPWVSVPLSADLVVDSAHWYALWVWCGTQDTGFEDYRITGETKNWSWAQSELSVSVPSISWRFDPLQAVYHSV